MESAISAQNIPTSEFSCCKAYTTSRSSVSSSMAIMPADFMNIFDD